MSNVILADSRYYGDAMCWARKCMRMRRTRAAEMLGVTYQDYLAYERGKRLIPAPIVQKIMHMAFIALVARTNK